MTPKRKQLFAGLVIISVLCWFEWAVLECGRCEGASKRRVLDHNTAVFYFLAAHHEWCLRACIYNLHAVWRSRMTNTRGSNYSPAQSCPGNSHSCFLAHRTFLSLCRYISTSYMFGSAKYFRYRVSQKKCRF